MVLAAKTADCPAGAVECIAESVYPADIANCCREPNYRQPLPPDERAALLEQLVDAVRDRMPIYEGSAKFESAKRRIIDLMEKLDGQVYRKNHGPLDRNPAGQAV